MSWKELLLALGPAVALLVGLRFVLKRRMAQAEALGRAAAQAELATATERLRGREEQLATARAELERSRTRIDELAAAAAEARERLAESEARLASEREQNEEKLALLGDAERKLTDAFARLSQEALTASNESFLTLARQSFETLQAGAQGDLEQRRQAIEALLGPMREQLTRYESGVREIEKAREQAYGSLSEQVRSLLSTQERLETETGNLVKALRAPQVRGRWGEMQLKRAVEFAGLVDHVDFVEQASTGDADSLQRPDLIVRLPGGKQVVVDAKAPLAAYLDALEAKDEDVRRLRLIDHARQVRDHVKKLAAKSYWSQFADAPDFVVLFLPGETFYSAALEQDPALIEDAFSESVLIATPTTLVALLKSVHYAWKQETLASNSRQIAEAALELYDRVRVFTEHFERIGTKLGDAAKAFNAAVGSFERSVAPQGRRLGELGAGAAKPIADPAAVEAVLRVLPERTE